jgi:hypothetical protein
VSSCQSDCGAALWHCHHRMVGCGSSFEEAHGCCCTPNICCGDFLRYRTCQTQLHAVVWAKGYMLSKDPHRIGLPGQCQAVACCQVVIAWTRSRTVGMKLNCRFTKVIAVCMLAVWCEHGIVAVRACLVARSHDDRWRPARSTLNTHASVGSHTLFSTTMVNVADCAYSI